MALKALLCLSALVAVASASPAATIQELQARDPAPDNIVYVPDAENFCMIMPRDPHTNIGESKHSGGMRTYCSLSGRYPTIHGQLPPDFWSNVEFKTGLSSRGAIFAQPTPSFVQELRIDY